MGFRCSKCGEWHDEEIRDLAFALPLPVAELSFEERKKRAYVSEDGCVLDGEHFFVRGVLEIPILGTGDSFAYGAWSSLSQQNYNLYIRTYNSGTQSSIGPFFGWLSNSLPLYPETFLLKSSVQPRDGNLRPLITLEPTDHPLSIEQHHGMTRERLLEILSSVQHHN